MAKKHTLEQKKPAKKPPFQMAEPNDDLDAYGWLLSRLRYASKDSTPGNVWPGRPIFTIPQTIDSITHYGHEAQFLCPKYVQIMLDRCPQIRKGAEKVRAAGYSPEALKKFAKIVLDEFDTVILVDIAQRFHKIAPMVAAFYAALLAHTDTFGPPGEEDDDKQPEEKPEDQIPPSTTKSRR